MSPVYVFVSSQLLPGTHPKRILFIWWCVEFVFDCPYIAPSATWEKPHSDQVSHIGFHFLLFFVI